ncbi:MAG: CoA transferase, partial [Desulfatiglandales bacterium]|nr:CoA transferase [Desulfatiglandales bacterium]
MKGVGKPMLEGLKIIELGMAVAGPVIVSYFCHYGATAVRVESSKKIDSMRTTPPYWQRKPGINRSLHVSNLNANKYSILLDLKTEKGKEIFRKLTRWADIIVENYRAGTLKKLGLGYEDLVKENDRLIMVSTTTQGQTGPYAKKVAGFGLHVESMAGFVNITGWPDREAVLGGGLQTDYISGKYSVAALIAAL